MHVSAQRFQAIKRGAGKRAGRDIAADDDRIGARRPRIGQHRAESVGVAVDVIKGKDPDEPVSLVHATFQLRLGRRFATGSRLADPHDPFRRLGAARRVIEFATIG